LSAIRFLDVGRSFVSHRTQTLALDRVRLEVAAGEIVSLVGPSGCGKTTLLRLAAGLIAPTSGEVWLLDQPVREPQREIGFVFQTPALLAWRSVRENIMLQAEMRDLPRAAALARTEELIALVGLTGFERAYPFELSGGMQQRVSLCRALLHEPPVLLMDEPFGALDALTREQMNVELLTILRRTRAAVLLVTHAIDEAIFLGDRVAVMTPRPGTIAEIIDVSLPRERDYEETMASPVKDLLARRVRELLARR
jgi:NitT/TauT family transport system ATP-binding protein